MQRLKVNIPNKEYDIEIEKGLINSIGEKIVSLYKGKKITIITDTNVYKLYGHIIEDQLSQYEVKTVVIQAGEESKNMTVLQDIYHRLLNFGMTKKDMIVTFGGGVVGDIGGYAAATLLRGIPFIQIPTTLLSQVDSSVGGKVAVNLREGKNLVGAFYQPKAVYIDPDMLDTLEDKYFNDGMGEVIKYGCIADEKLFNRLLQYDKETFLDNIEDIIYICCDIKRMIVQVDEKDKGVRMILNFGHTIGHGVESYYDYKGYSHGEAVAIGMYYMALIGEILEVTQKGTAKGIKELVTRFNLPYSLGDIPTAELIKRIMNDKKSDGDSINIILIKEIGNAFIENIDKSELKVLVERGRDASE